MRSSTVETLIGAFVVFIAAGFLMFAYSNSNMRGTAGGYRLTADFDSIDGVAIGSDVRIAGIKVGTVLSESLVPENSQARVTFSVDPAVHLTDDTAAKVTAEGLLGAKYIVLEPGGSETLLKEGDMITQTQGAIDIWSLISQVMFAKKDGAGEANSAGSSNAPAVTAPSGDTPPDTPLDITPDGQPNTGESTAPTNSKTQPAK